MQRASLASSSLPNRNAASPRVARAAATRQAAAPLISQAPSPIARLRVTRSVNGSALQAGDDGTVSRRSEEHTYELQSLMRSSYAVFCLKKQTETYRFTVTPFSLNDDT